MNNIEQDLDNEVEIPSYEETFNTDVFGVSDHLGFVYQSIDEMCNAHGVTIEYFTKQANKGCCLEQALNKNFLWQDILGECFINKNTMLAKWHINLNELDYLVKYCFSPTLALRFLMTKELKKKGKL